MSARVTHSPDVAELGLRPSCAAGSGLPPRHKQRMEQTAGAATGLEKSSKLEHAKTELSGSYYAEEGGVMEQSLTGVKRANAAAAPDQQQKPAKRTRRERGSASKDRISKIPPPLAGKRSSVYRGVTRHRWTGRYEAHLWDKSTWNQNQNKKGKQVYLGAYDDEEAAARAYDLAALKYWGVGTIINFPVNDYARDVEEMQNVSREEYLASLRRKSSGFSRGVSKYRGVARHHHNGRWEARIGRVFGNKYLYLGTYGTQEEAAAAYDMAAIEYRGLNAVTNFDLSRYIKWLRPGQSNVQTPGETDDLTGGLHQIMEPTVECQLSPPEEQQLQQQQVHIWPRQETELEPYQFPSLGDSSSSLSMQSDHSGLEFEAAAPTALGLLWQSNVFKQMLEKASAHASCEEGMAMSGIFPSLEEEASRIPYEDEGLAADLTLPLPLPFTSFSHSSPGFSEAQEVWNSLANSLPMRSPISV